MDATAGRMDCAAVLDGFFVGHERGVGAVCMSCGRHVEERDSECPFCGVRLVWSDSEARRRRCMAGHGAGVPREVMRWGVDLRESAEGDIAAGAPCVTAYRVKGGSMLSEPPVVVFDRDLFGGFGRLDALDGVAVSLGYACYAVYDASDARSVQAVADAMRERWRAFLESGNTLDASLQEVELRSMLDDAVASGGVLMGGRP